MLTFTLHYLVKQLIILIVLARYKKVPQCFNKSRLEEYNFVYYCPSWVDVYMVEELIAFICTIKTTYAFILIIKRMHIFDNCIPYISYFLSSVFSTHSFIWSWVCPYYHICFYPFCNIQCLFWCFYCLIW